MWLSKPGAALVRHTFDEGGLRVSMEELRVSVVEGSVGMLCVGCREEDRVKTRHKHPVPEHEESNHSMEKSQTRPVIEPGYPW